MFLDFGLKWQYQGRTGEIKSGQESLFHRAFVNLRRELMDWSPAFEIIAEDILTPFMSEQFVDQGTPGGMTWQQLAPSTIQARGGSDYPILINTGFLLRSFTEKGGHHHQEITPKKLVWGSDVPYSIFHQTGTLKGFQRATVPTGPGTGRGMPMRKILAFPDALKHRMASTMRGRITQVARQIGFRIAGREGIDAGEARRIGNIALGLRP